jgi:hypothetical protein
MQDSDFFGPSLTYDEPMVVPTPDAYPASSQASVLALPPALGNIGHEMPSPFQKGMERSESFDVMPMPAGYQPQLVDYNYPPMPARRSVGTVEEVQASTHKHMVGLSILLAGGGAAVGYTQGGAYGAFAGSLFGGSVVNAYRAFKFYMDGSEGGAKEAVVSGTYALVAAAAGGLLWYKFVHEKPEHVKKNPTCDKDVMGDNPCGIRRVI